jgi:hypothetical protein
MLQRRLALFLFLAACKSTSVADAETKGDVKWLEDNGSPEAVAALGRLADKDTKAANWMESHAGMDPGVYIAAWEATERGAPWGPSTLKSALADPARADVAASGMKRQSPKLAQFVPDLEGAVSNVQGTRPSTVASVLASIGAPASATIENRLRDAKTRGAMCRGIGGADSSPESRAVLLKVSPESRDDAGCLEAITQLSIADPATFDWLAASAETGLLRHAGEGSGMPCTRVAQLWKTVVEKRQPSEHGALAIPMGAAIKRCPPEMDGILPAMLDGAKAAPLVIAAIDPYDRSTSELKQTCPALTRATRDARVPRRSIERAQDELAHGCPR